MEALSSLHALQQDLSVEGNVFQLFDDTAGFLCGVYLSSQLGL